MNITGIHPITDIENYNSIRRLEPLQAGSTASANAAQENGQQSRSAEAESSYAKPKQPEKQMSFDYAGQYDPKAEYELKGTDSDLMSLDVEKAISDMKRDQVLQQYQFFVGENLENGSVTNTGIDWEKIRTSENFEIQ